MKSRKPKSRTFAELTGASLYPPAPGPRSSDIVAFRERELAARRAAVQVDEDRARLAAEPGE